MGTVPNEMLEQQLAYWKQQLQGAPSILALPTDYLRPSVQTGNRASCVQFVPASLCKHLEMLNRREDVTLFTVLISALTMLLGRYSSQQDIVIGTSVKRQQRGLAGT